MILLSWNIRGFGKAEKKRVVKGLVSKFKPMVLFLQETKLKSFDSRIIRAVGGQILNRGVGVDAIGLARGLLSLWNDEQFVISDCILRTSCILLVGELVEQKMVVGFCNVYAPCVESERKSLWNDLANLMNSFPIPWVVGGDFNVVVSVNQASMRNFGVFLSDAGVVDIPMQGMSFTWTNSRENAAWARLDRFLISPSLLLCFPNLRQIGLPRSVSDHNPILLSEAKEDWGPRPFRFVNVWLEDVAMMKDAIADWKEKGGGFVKGAALAAKTKETKIRMKNWITTFVSKKSSVAEDEARLASIDEEAVRVGWTEKLRKDRVHMFLPPDVAKLLPKNRLLSETEWCAIGVHKAEDGFIMSFIALNHTSCSLGGLYTLLRFCDKMLLGESVASIAKTFLESDAAVIEIKQPEAVAAGIRQRSRTVLPKKKSSI
ncbi:hypothetical protein LWI29_028940 [Acer saccharum]|uniref:Endonuclease/exonuclease/phosphatase domain-containing protein n=1 Tax=Acer saccharum TaxID=4024 RepID=A0AA39SXK8_ACESA|nr:hypothetical protein LWI29_028940 [Acer saccharum]